MARVPVVKNVRGLVAQGRAVVAALAVLPAEDAVKSGFGAARVSALSAAVESLETQADTVENLSRQYDASIAARRGSEDEVMLALRTIRGLVVAFNPENERAAATYGFDVVTTAASRSPVPAVSTGG
jgi:hypothetical protein